MNSTEKNLQQNKERFVKIINNSKLPITVCKQIIGRGKELVIEDEIFNREYSKNIALQDAVSRKELTVLEDKKKKGAK